MTTAQDLLLDPTSDVPPVTEPQLQDRKTTTNAMADGFSLDDLKGKKEEAKKKEEKEEESSEYESEVEDEETEEEDDSAAEEEGAAKKPAEAKKKPRKLKPVKRMARVTPKPKPQGPPVSTHLWYPTKGDIRGFQVGLRVPKGGDFKCTYFMAVGWHRGYFGMQVNSCPSERRILFSCWDDGKGNDVKVLDAHEEHLTKRFGGEGTGRQCIRWHRWDVEDLLLFRVFAEPQKDGTTHYSGYFKHKDDDWVFMCEYKSPNDGKWLTGIYSFLENFGSERRVGRECYYSHQAYQTKDSEEWIPVRTAKCTISTCPDQDWHYHGTQGEAFVMRIGGTKGDPESKDFCETFIPSTLHLD